MERIAREAAENPQLLKDARSPPRGVSTRAGGARAQLRWSVPGAAPSENPPAHERNAGPRERRRSRCRVAGGAVARRSALTGLIAAIAMGTRGARHAASARGLGAGDALLALLAPYISGRVPARLNRRRATRGLGWSVAPGTRCGGCSWEPKGSTSVSDTGDRSSRFAACCCLCPGAHPGCRALRAGLHAHGY
jgi:hypothetical protein